MTRHVIGPTASWQASVRDSECSRLGASKPECQQCKVPVCAGELSRYGNSAPFSGSLEPREQFQLLGCDRSEGEERGLQVILRQILQLLEKRLPFICVV